MFERQLQVLMPSAHSLRVAQPPLIAAYFLHHHFTVSVISYNKS